MKNNHFGRKGWAIILYCCFSYYLAAGLSTVTLNWYPAAFGALRPEWGGVQAVAGLSNLMSGLGGWLGILFAMLFSVLASRFGSRKMAIAGNILCAVFCLIFAFTPNLFVFCAMIICNTIVSGNVQMNVVPNNIMNIWFPKKKGMALGWATMGLPLCTATLILILNRIGSPSGAYGFMALLCLTAAVLAAVLVKDTPEQAGVTPDNEPADREYLLMISRRQREMAKKLTTAVILRNRNTWLIGIGMGLLWLATIGMISNFIPHLVSCGLERFVAVPMLTVTSLIAIAASYVWGFIDQRIGIKKTCVISGIWYMAALLIMIRQDGTMGWVWAACIFVGCSVGGIGNLIPSMVGSCFGRFGFIEANRIIAPLQSIRYLGFVIISAAGMQNLVVCYWVFLIFTAAGTVMMFLIRIPQYDEQTGDPVGIYDE